MKWLEDLLERIASFLESNPVIEEPDEEVAENEKIIGEVPENLKKVHAYMDFLAKKLKKMVKEYNKEELEGPGHTPETRKKFHDSLSPLMDELKIVKVAFWREFQNELKISVEGIGVRRGWKVVEIPTSEESEKPEMSIHIIGIGGGGIDPLFASLVRAMTH